MKTYTAAIVDDTPEYRQYVKASLAKAGQEYDRTIRTKEFSKGETLLYELKENHFYDIYVIDIEMPEMNGIELGKTIKKMKPDARVIFVTSYTRYAIESYEIDAYQYILKDKLEERLPRTLKKLFDEEETDDSYYTIATESRFEKFRFKDIIWIYRDEKNAVFVTEEKKYKQRSTLNEVFSRLPQDEFLFVERGTIVNLRHVCGIDKNEILLTNGERVVAGRKHAKNVKERAALYWGRQI